MSAPPRLALADPDGHLHDVELTLCAGCGCVQYQAQDLSGRVWDAGPDQSRGCGDHACSCHTAPRYGERRHPVSGDELL
ncbi:MAG: hypothetical protein ACJ77A_14605 [Actinomycetota bacterium]